MAIREACMNLLAVITIGISAVVIWFLMGLWAMLALHPSAAMGLVAKTLGSQRPALVDIGIEVFDEHDEDTLALVVSLSLVGLLWRKARFWVAAVLSTLTLAMLVYTAVAFLGACDFLAHYFVHGP